MNILTDEELDKLSDRLDRASKKFWDDWFDKHFKQGNTMNDTVNTVNATTVANKEELAKILGIPADQITDVKVTEGKDEVQADADKAQTPAQ